MNLFELRHRNALSVYQSILDGIDTLSGISKETGISLLTVSELANDMVRRELLDISKPKRDKVGRRVHKFKPSHKYYTIFIDKQSQYFSTIGISTSGIAVERFDYPLNYEKRTCQDVLTNYVIKRVKSSPNFKYCMAIYLLGAENDNFVIDDDIIMINKEDLIAKSFADKNKTILFDFNDKYIMSLYSNIHYTTADKETICKVFNFDSIYTFRGNLYYESFDALTRIAKMNIEIII
ncbi:MAG: hypothetical protein E7596_01395 [Ruminococcaceae bacterium]|nr:hypothetical protein [Oscillospiraceae bacterium]